jgi:hypothetical protein
MGLWKVVPGDIATVHPRRQWRYAGHPYLSGDIAHVRLDVPALGLVPLRLEPFDTWNPAEIVSVWIILHDETTPRIVTVMPGR